ncbi:MULTISPECIES: hypothetical protein [Corynebacterium]|uniref:dTDP-glucose 4,6-dehydratase n=1 Tax=Corynebacterium genitalium ATCC 33030 TaxID=585529 RepID=D7WB94_9CORY|nr:hypothetical protein HMPREF0291_10383 [Corynebacterium genitalium ATCC 33030]
MGGADDAADDELSWRPHYTDMREGLANTIEWYRSNEAWWREAKDAVEDAYASRGQ